MNICKRKQTAVQVGDAALPRGTAKDDADDQERGCGMRQGVDALVWKYQDGHISKRDFIVRATALGIAASVIASIVAVSPPRGNAPIPMLKKGDAA